MPRLGSHRGLIGVAVAGVAVIVVSLMLRAGTAPPADQASTSRTEASASKGPANGQGHGAQILPVEPYGFSLLSVRLDVDAGITAAAAVGTANGAADANPDAGELRTVWSVNGEDVSQGSTLSPTLFDRGDEVRVRVERMSAGQQSQVVAWASTTIRNAPPLLRTVEVHPVEEQPGQVEAHVEAADPDGDAVELEYAWLSAGEPIEGANSARMSVTELTRGQSLAVRVIANDGRDLSTPSLATWSQENQPPSIAATTEASVSRDESGQARVSCPLQVTDPDGDSVTVELVDPVDGLQWDAAEGNLIWLPALEVRQIAVTVRARDDKGGEAQRTLQLSF